MANVQDIMNEIDRIENAKGELAEAIGEKGVGVPAEAHIQQYPSYVRAIPTSIEEFFKCIYGMTPANLILNALSENKFPIVFYQNRLYIYHSEQNGKIYFITILSKESYFVSVDESNDAWSNDSVELYEKPNDGIPDTDLSQAVQDAIVLALTAYQKPTTGIPASDLAEGVIPAAEIFWATYGTTTAAEIKAAAEGGKIVACLYESGGYKRVYYYAREVVGGVDWNGLYLTELYSSGCYYLFVRTDNNAWSSGSIDLQRSSDKLVSLAKLIEYRTSTTKYPCAKATFDGLGQYGVVSQTQTWSGSGSNPRTYVMSDLVYGLIPQANIDLFVSAGATFNTTTGYFELNGLTDISYEEMRMIYDAGQLTAGGNNFGYRFQGKQVRTTLPFKADINTSNMPYYTATQLYNSSAVEVVALIVKYNGDIIPTRLGGISYIAADCRKLRKIINPILLVDTLSTQNFSYSFSNCNSLEELSLGRIGKDVSFAQSSLLNLASIVYMVDNAANTSAITITLHATAYARCQADTTEYTYGGQTYTGILAYASARNITIAAA